MSNSLVDALENVELATGKTYCCEVGGRYVELRVFANSPKALAPVPIVSKPSATITEEDIMLDPWCELPSPPPLRRIKTRIVASLPVDIPEIPVSEVSI